MRCSSDLFFVRQWPKIPCTIRNRRRRKPGKTGGRGLKVPHWLSRSETNVAVTIRELYEGARASTNGGEVTTMRRLAKTGMTCAIPRVRPVRCSYVDPADPHGKQCRGDQAVADHVARRPDAAGGDAEQAEHDEAQLGDRGVAQPLCVALNAQRPAHAIPPMMASPASSAASGWAGKRPMLNRRYPYAPSLSVMAASITEAPVGAWACAVGSHVCSGNMGVLMKKASVNAAKQRAGVQGPRHAWQDDLAERGSRRPEASSA